MRKLQGSPVVDNSVAIDSETLPIEWLGSM